MTDKDCCSNGHEFQIAKSNYYKLKIGDGCGFGSTYDQAVAYSVLYCLRCGATKEIVSTDHRRKAAGDE